VTAEFSSDNWAVEATVTWLGSLYYSPQFHHAAAIAQAGADIIAIDATPRVRPNGETLDLLVRQIHDRLSKPVLADVDSLAAGTNAARAGADAIATTLYGYTNKPNIFLLQGLNFSANSSAI